MKSYYLRIVKIVKKPETDTPPFFAILLQYPENLKPPIFLFIFSSKTLDDNKTYILLKRLDTLQLEWHQFSNDEEKIHMEIDLNYPPMNETSLLKLYSFEEANKRKNPTMSSKDMINMLFEFFHVSSHVSSNFAFFEKASAFVKVDEELKEKVRCKICNYIVGDLEVLLCQECGNYFHFQCLPNHQSLPIKTSEIYKEWVCKDCAFCGICYNKGKKDGMVNLILIIFWVIGLKNFDFVF